MIYPVIYLAYALIIIAFLRVRPDAGSKNRWSDIIVCLLIGALTVLTFDTSPLAKGIYDGDASVFMYIGRMMQRGYVPYRDMFDHKGPWLYFIEWFGLLGGVTGLWILEWICVSLSSYLIFLITGLYTEDKRARYITVFGLIFIAGIHLYEGGNYTEVWSLPLACLSLYIFLKFLEQKIYSSRAIVAAGASFMAVFLLRCNLIAVWVVFIPVIIIELIRQKRSREIIKCVVLFCAGMIIAFLPVLIYYGYNNAISDMYKCYWEYNIYYVDSSSSSDTALYVFFLYGKYFLIGWIALIPMVIKLKGRAVVHLLFAAASIVLDLLSCRPYAHYFVPVIPCFVVPMTLMFSFIYQKAGKASDDTRKSKAVAAVLAVGIAMTAFAVVYPTFSDNKQKAAGDSELVTFIENNTEPGDDVYFLFGNGYWSLVSGRYTEQKYFYLYPVTYNDELCDDMLRSIKDNPPDYIIAPIKWNDIEEVRRIGNGWERPVTGIDKVCSELGYTKTAKGSFLCYSLK